MTRAANFILTCCLYLLAGFIVALPFALLLLAAKKLMEMSQ